MQAVVKTIVTSVKTLDNKSTSEPNLLRVGGNEASSKPNDLSRCVCVGGHIFIGRVL